MTGFSPTVRSVIRDRAMDFIEGTAPAWLPVPGFEGLYEVSNEGSVRSVDRVVPHPRYVTAHRKGQLLSLSQQNRGHYRAYLSRDGVIVPLLVHRLVMLAFVGPAPDGRELCCHKDGDPTNNVVGNLYWGTHSDNQRDAVRHGMHASTRKTHCPQGHEYTPENTAYKPPNRRVCRECKRASRRRSYLREKKQRNS